MRRSSSFWCVLSVLNTGGCEGFIQHRITRLVPLVFTAGPQLRAVNAWKNCRKFKDIYPSSKELCEVSFGDAFEYSTDESSAYTMWWFDKTNPNDAVATSLSKPEPETCDLQYFHKEGPPSAEGAEFTECHPWKEKACCHHATVMTPTALNNAYGEGYRWDRCGPMSEACARFFVQEACFYECEVHAGNYRRYSDATVAVCKNLTSDHPQWESNGCAGPAGALNNFFGPNAWQLYKMPIKASYCDAWYLACSNDYFCGSGDFFECAVDYFAEEARNKTLNEELARNRTRDAAKGGGDDVEAWAIALIAILGGFILVACAGIYFMVMREKRGKPIFQAMTTKPVEATASQAAQA